MSYLSFKSGETIRDAVENVIEELAALTGGVTGCVTVYAVDRIGDARVVALNAPEPVHYWYWCETMPRAECRRAEHVNIPNVR